MLLGLLRRTKGNVGCSIGAYSGYGNTSRNRYVFQNVGSQHPLHSHATHGFNRWGAKVKLQGKRAMQGAQVDAHLERLRTEYTQMTRTAGLSIGKGGVTC